MKLHFGQSGLVFGHIALRPHRGFRVMVPEYCDIMELYCISKIALCCIWSIISKKELCCIWGMISRIALRCIWRIISKIALYLQKHYVVFTPSIWTDRPEQTI